MAPDPAARALGPFIAYDAGVAVEHPGIGGDSGLDPSNKFIRVGLGETASTLNFPAQVAAARGIPRAQVAPQICSSVPIDLGYRAVRYPGEFFCEASTAYNNFA